jgi:hypothetical protein
MWTGFPLGLTDQTRRFNHPDYNTSVNVKGYRETAARPGTPRSLPIPGFQRLAFCPSTAEKCENKEKNPLDRILKTEYIIAV